MNESGLEIYLIRHGETAWSLTGQHTGRTDLPLTRQGEAMARQLATRLQAVAFDRVLTSPSLRARTTCSLAGLAGAGQFAAQTDARLAEWDYGEFEGMRSTEIHQQHADWNLWRDGCPGGESPAEIGKRADQLIETLAEHKGRVALFSHGQFGRVLAARWTGLPLEVGQHLVLDPASISIFGALPGPPPVHVIALWNASANGELPA